MLEQGMQDTSLILHFRQEIIGDMDTQYGSKIFKTYLDLVKKHTHIELAALVTCTLTLA